MLKRIPITAAKKVAEEYGGRQVILFVFDDDNNTHCVTYGKSVEDCEQAANGGNKLKKVLGWPDSLIAEASRAKKRRGEYEYLKWFFQNVYLGPADGHGRSLLNDRFKKETGKEIPKGYEID